MQADSAAAIQRGLDFVRRAQTPNGGFITDVSAADAPFVTHGTTHTVFVPALILDALHAVPAADSICRPLAAWLLTQKSAAWSFNYWMTDSAEQKTAPLPDDLDVTCCALSALYHYNPSLVDGTALAHTVKLLLATETQVGGPYRTWLTNNPAPAWRDIDIAVNANIAYFLRLVAQPPPPLMTFLEQAICRDEVRSPYYPSPPVINYFLARAYNGPHTPSLVRQVRTQPAENAHDVALKLLALSEMGQSRGLKPLLHRLLAAQQDDGSWPPAALCVGPGQSRHGSAALTTALAVAALRQCRQRTSNTKPFRTDGMIVAITARAEAELAGLAPEISEPLIRTIHGIARSGNAVEIMLLPRLFAAALPPRFAMPPAAVQQLGLANLYGWAAYTIFDDFIDDEGRPALLPAATVAMRRSLHTFERTLPGNNRFQAFVGHTFDAIDSANAWEVTHCRFPVKDQTITIGTLPRYGNRLRLAARSAGHMLPPLAILMGAGLASSNREFTTVKRALAHYIVAKQLLDDAHDWEDDLRAGRISYAVAAVLRDARVPSGRHQFESLLPRLRQCFWHRTIVTLCRHIETHLADSRAACQQSGLLNMNDTSFIPVLFPKLEQALTKTRTEQSNARKFLAAYKSNA